MSTGGDEAAGGRIGREDSMLEDIRGKRVVVTGAGTGIGSGIALAFARAGADVVVHYSHSAAGAQKTVAEIRGLGRTAVPLRADFDDLAAVTGFARTALDALGGLDVLVNNAGITLSRPFEAVTGEQFDTLYRVNVRAPFFLVQALLPALRASRGTVVNLSSIHAFEGHRDFSVYAGTRGAIVSFTRQLAVELAPLGVSVKGIAPGAVPVESHLGDGGDLEQMRRSVSRGIPSGFAGTPEDIGNVAVFLASRASRYLVGQTVVVDGGTTSWMPFGEGFREGSGVAHGKGYVPGV